jgi:hypothetical protein
VSAVLSVDLQRFTTPLSVDLATLCPRLALSLSLGSLLFLVVTHLPTPPAKRTKQNHTGNLKRWNPFAVLIQMANIPPEIWSAVFLRVVESDPTNLPSLMFVSRTWHRIASSSPRLWARLSFEQPKHFTNPSYANLFLTNSGARPLDVLIHVPPEVEDTSLLTALLRKHVSRFRTLVLHVDLHDYAEDLVSSIGDAQPAPLLERLIIKVATKDTKTRYFAALGDAFQPAPRLTHLTLPAYPLPTSFSLLSTITYLTLDAFQYSWDIDLQENLDLLASVPRLECFTFKGSDNFAYFRLLNDPAVPMPHLTSVDVSVPGCGLDLLCALRAPLLRYVRYDAWRDEDHFEEWDDGLTEPILKSLRLLSQESPVIESIELRSTVFPNAAVDYRWLLNPVTFPHLEVLRLDSSDITDDALVGSHPNLKRLELRHCSGVSGVGLRRFVEGCGEDFQLIVDGCAGVTQEDIKVLSQVVKVEST